MGLLGKSHLRLGGNDRAREGQGHIGREWANPQGDFEGGGGRGVGGRGERVCSGVGCGMMVQDQLRRLATGFFYVS